MDCSPPASSVHGIFQARTLEWVAIPFSRRSSRPTNQTQVSCVEGGFLHCRQSLYQLSYKGSPFAFYFPDLWKFTLPGKMGLSVQFSHVWLFVTPWTAACQASLSLTNSWSLLKLMSIASVMPSNHLILCRPLLPPSIFHSIRVFSNESILCIRWPKYWSFSFGISPFNEHPGLISFKMDWLDLLAVQGTLKSLLQCHSSKVSILYIGDWISVLPTRRLSYIIQVCSKYSKSSF